MTAVPEHLAGRVEDVLISRKEIDDRVAELARDISADYAGKKPVLVGVLKGAFMFLSDLSKGITEDCTFDFMAVSSYGTSTKSSGVVRILKDLDTEIAGRHVIVVEDIVDTGLTLDWLLGNLASRGPASVEVAALLAKPAARKVDVDVKYLGFEVENRFVVGYGLDYAEFYRNIDFIGVLTEAAQKTPPSV